MMGIANFLKRIARLSRFFLLLLLALAAGCTPPAKAPKKEIKVIVTNPITDRVVDYQDFTGRVDAVKSVDVRARATGYVTDVFFQEGDRVQEGKPLFQIDVGPYMADYNQADADLKLAIADRKLLAKNAERAQQMWLTKSIAPEEYQTTLATLDKMIAMVNSKAAMKDKTKLYLDYTTVLAPVTGRISRRFVDPGNLITADTTVLTTIVTENPMYAYFDVDERTFLDLLANDKKTPSAKLNNWRSAVLGYFASQSFPDVFVPLAVSQASMRPVLMSLANEKDFERVGYVDFIDNRIIATTGTIRMRGVFQNRLGELTPGLFVRIRLPIGVPFNAILIPDLAILSDQERKYVWVINAKNEAEYRSVKLGQAIRELRVILPADPGKEGKEGLTESDRVVISGVQRVSAGKVVEAKFEAPRERPGMPLVKLLEARR